jgi:hypothetical protein
MALKAFDDQCTGANRAIRWWPSSRRFLKVYYGEEYGANARQLEHGEDRGV